MDMIPHYPDRNRTEPQRLCYRAGWVLAADFDGLRGVAFVQTWARISAAYPDASRVDCAVAFVRAWQRKRYALHVARMRDRTVAALSEVTPC